MIVQNYTASERREEYGDDFVVRGQGAYNFVDFFSAQELRAPMNNATDDAIHTYICCAALFSSGRCSFFVFVCLCVLLWLNGK